ncbi:MAG: thiosulfate oxidation carrier protein SoxY [Burkholderiales bacterium]
MKRREFLQQAGGGGLMAALVAAGWWPTGAEANDWNKAAFEGKKLEDVLKALGGVDAKASDEIQITAIEIAENGAVVPIGMTSRLPGTDTLAVLVEKNPNMLAAVFTLPAGTLPELQTRVKMAQTSNVYVLARAGGRFAYATKEIKVTLGGCGG